MQQKGLLSCRVMYCVKPCSWELKRCAMLRLLQDDFPTMACFYLIFIVFHRRSPVFQRWMRRFAIMHSVWPFALLIHADLMTPSIRVAVDCVDPAQHQVWAGWMGILQQKVVASASKLSQRVSHRFPLVMRSHSELCLCSLWYPHGAGCHTGRCAHLMGRGNGEMGELSLGVCAQGFMSAIEHHGFPISKAEARISGILEVEVGRNMWPFPQFFKLRKCVLPEWIVPKQRKKEEYQRNIKVHTHTQWGDEQGTCVTNMTWSSLGW